ncbi:hypothetical protein [Chitinolyticbacter albus]|nr:hypothetical protein [Chitinolyticbacter albus]
MKSAWAIRKWMLPGRLEQMADIGISGLSLTAANQGGAPRR